MCLIPGGVPAGVEEWGDPELLLEDEWSILSSGTVEFCHDDEAASSPLPLTGSFIALLADSENAIPPTALDGVVLKGSGPNSS